MAEESTEEKTEEPTSKRREEMRSEGVLARSQELMTVTSLVAALAGLAWLGKNIFESIRLGLIDAFNFGSSHLLDHAWLWVGMAVVPVAHQLLLFTLLLLVSVIAVSLLQTGLLFSMKIVKPQMSRVNPFAGTKKLMSPQSFITFLKSLIKVVIMSVIAWIEIKSHLSSLQTLSLLSTVEGVAWIFDVLGGAVFKIIIFLGALAAADYLHQWYKTHEKLMMTRQELKEEMKSYQLPPHIRSKMRQVANERAKQAIRKEVPKADVIVTNPTHFAVAIRYRRGVDQAPRVTAKGQDHLAATIREIATKHNVPIYEYPELARALYKQTRVGKLISQEHWEGVSRVLAYIYQMYRRRSNTPGEGMHVG